MVIISDNTEKSIGRNLKNEIIARHKIKKIISSLLKKNKVNLVLYALCVIITATFIVAWLLQNRGTFTVAASREDMIVYGLVLSDNPIFDRPRPKLESEAVNAMWNITQSDIPANVDNIDGGHNGEDYLAYTFYVRNQGEEKLNYKATLDITDLHLAVDNAMRIKIYINGVPTVFAKPKSDGSGEPEPDTVSFAAKTRIVNYMDKQLDVNQTDKYTVVIWLEGEDPECVNDIMGGSAKLVMEFTALSRTKKAT